MGKRVKKTDGNGAKLRCLASGCRNVPKEQGFCKKHEVERSEALNPMDAVHRITEIEAATFRALDAEARNLSLAVKGLKLEVQVADLEFEKIIAGHKRRQEIRGQQIEQTQAQIETCKVEYLCMVNALAEKRGMDAKFMAVDTEARTIRDLRGETVEASSTSN